MKRRKSSPRARASRSRLRSSSQALSRTVVPVAVELALRASDCHGRPWPAPPGATVYSTGVPAKVVEQLTRGCSLDKDREPYHVRVEPPFPMGNGRLASGAADSRVGRPAAVPRDAIGALDNAASVEEEARRRNWLRREGAPPVGSCWSSGAGGLTEVVLDVRLSSGSSRRSTLAPSSRFERGCTIGRLRSFQALRRALAGERRDPGSGRGRPST